MLQVSLELLSPRPLTSKEERKALLALWLRLLPEYTPERYGNTEPLKFTFDPQDLDSVLTAWDLSLMAKRAKPKATIYSSMRHPRREPEHASFCSDIESKAVPQALLLRFLKDAAALLEADFAFLHLMTENDVQWAIQNRTIIWGNAKRTKFSLHVAWHHLQKRLPDLYWATVLGPPYVKLFGRDKLLMAPAPHVESIGEDQILLQLSDQLEDFGTNFEVVDGVRQAVKRHLNSNAFFDPANSALHGYNVPEFIWK